MIPRKLHRIWLGSPIPIEHEATWQLWRDTFPDYELITWTETELACLGVPKYFDSARTYAERADIARLRIVNVHGGLYIDCDVKPILRFDHLWTAEDQLIAFEEHPGMVYNGIFAAVPGALSFIERFVERNARRDSNRAAPPTMRTGPFAFTAGIRYHCSMDPSGVRIYPPSFLDLDGSAKHAVVSTRFRVPQFWTPVEKAADPISSFRRDLLFDLRMAPVRARRALRRRLSAS